MGDDCIRCDGAPAADELGYCGHCHWAVKVEVVDGLYRLSEYLDAWSSFEAWCAGREASR
jgi:hypothetical protein